MRKLHENFHIFYFQKRTVSAETICRNTVCKMQKKCQKKVAFANIFCHFKFCHNIWNYFRKTHFPFTLLETLYSDLHFSIPPYPFTLFCFSGQMDQKLFTDIILGRRRERVPIHLKVSFCWVHKDATKVIDTK